MTQVLFITDVGYLDLNEKEQHNNDNRSHSSSYPYTCDEAYLYILQILTFLRASGGPESIECAFMYCNTKIDQDISSSSFSKATRQIVEQYRNNLSTLCSSSSSSSQTINSSLSSTLSSASSSSSIRSERLTKVFLKACQDIAWTTPSSSSSSSSSFSHTINQQFKHLIFMLAPSEDIRTADVAKINRATGWGLSLCLSCCLSLCTSTHNTPIHSLSWSFLVLLV